MFRKPLLALLGLGLVVPPGLAQQSASFKLTEHVFNAGGHPDDGVVLTSASFKITLDALGESLARRGLASESYKLDAGLVPAYPPPGEVHDLRFSDSRTVVWSAEPSAGVYDLYRDDAPGGYGTCEQSGLPAPEATDAGTPGAGDTFFYLVTVKNLLQEEGTKGTQSDGAERGGPTDLPACP